MNFFYVVFFGIVQGLTEFLPVSSTGHLVILEKIFNLSSTDFGLSFDVALHLGTLAALLLFFRKKILQIILDFLKGERKMVYMLIVGTIPAAIFGLFIEKYIKSDFRNLFLIAFNLIIFSFVFYFSEKYSNNSKNSPLTYKKSFFIGIFQSLALFPGVSRSGISIAGGFFNRLNKKEAGEYAFLLSIPIVIIASIKDFYNLYSVGFNFPFLQSAIFGGIISFITGYFSIKFFLGYLSNKGLMPFIIYRILLGFAILIYLIKI